MRQFKEFANGKIAVTCKDGAEQIRFLKLCEANDIRWACRHKATEFCPAWKGDAIGAMVIDSLLVIVHDKEEFMVDEGGYSTVPASEFFIDTKPIIEFVSEQCPEFEKEILIKFSCPSTYGSDYGYTWKKPAYCNGGRPRNGEDVCKKCWERPIGELAWN